MFVLIYMFLPYLVSMSVMYMFVLSLDGMFVLSLVSMSAVYMFVLSNVNICPVLSACRWCTFVLSLHMFVLSLVSMSVMYIFILYLVACQ